MQSKKAPIERGGRFTLPKQFHLDRFSLFYTGHGNTNLSTNRTGYACGVQVDDIEIWNRFPDKYNP
ncbi:MAG: hypothetical protein MK008_10555 [Bdellovibrionales bacterium]|nr:hypothetical protein [Bdellovibrionales bacterium]